MKKQTEKRRFGYIRVSSKTQNEGRQRDALLNEGILERDIFIDKQSGKDFSRPAYQQMIQSLQPGDEIVILDLDRLGRSYSEMAKEWNYITEERECNIRVINYPLLNTAQEEKTLDRRFIAKLTFEILSYVGEKEKSEIQRRQREGIESAKAKGVRFGRTKIPRPEGFEGIYQRVLRREITNRQAMRELNLKPNTYYAFVKELTLEKP
ncbi:MAG: recombinase family protein [Lachnospiraceae bacterium]|nr:recombinase family protein [Lachnospiraceae bacterium]